MNRCHGLSGDLLVERGPRRVTCPRPWQGTCAPGSADLVVKSDERSPESGGRMALPAFSVLPPERSHLPRRLTHRPSGFPTVNPTLQATGAHPFNILSYTRSNSGTSRHISLFPPVYGSSAGQPPQYVADRSDSSAAPSHFIVPNALITSFVMSIYTRIVVCLTFDFQDGMKRCGHPTYGVVTCCGIVHLCQ